jgi:hypothetical protein
MGQLVISMRSVAVIVGAIKVLKYLFFIIIILDISNDSKIPQNW